MPNPSRGMVWRLFWSHLLLTLEVIGGVHWQALKIWLNGGRYVPRSVPGPARVSIVESMEVSG